MANIPKVDGNFELEINNATQSYEDILYTDNKVISGDIHIHITAKSGVLNNTYTSGQTYTENESPQTIIPANGYLYLNEGYYPNTKISLGHMLPDPSGTYSNPGTADIRSGKKAYDGEGNEIIGTMPDVTPSFSGGVASVVNTANTINVNGLKTATVSAFPINAQASAKAKRTSVSYANNYTGYLDKASGVVASGETISGASQIDAVTIYLKPLAYSGETTTQPNTSTYPVQVAITPSTVAKYVKIDEGYGVNKQIQVNPIPSEYIIPSGTITLTSSHNVDVTQYAKADVQSASGLTISVSPASSVSEIIIGTYTNGYYSVSADVYLAPSLTQEGWAAWNGGGKYSCAGAPVGKIKSFEETTTTTQPDTLTYPVSIIVSPYTIPTYIKIDEGYTTKHQLIFNGIQTEEKTVKSTQSTQTITPTSGKFISKVVVNPVIVQSKTATPTTATQTITVDNGYDYLSSVKVEPIPSDYVIPSGTLNINASGVTDCKTFASVSVTASTLGSVTTTQPSTTTYPVRKTINASTDDQYLPIYEGFIENGQIKIEKIANAPTPSVTGVDTTNNVKIKYRSDGYDSIYPQNRSFKVYFSSGGYVNAGTYTLSAPEWNAGDMWTADVQKGYSSGVLMGTVTPSVVLQYVGAPCSFIRKRTSSTTIDTSFTATGEQNGQYFKIAKINGFTNGGRIQGTNTTTTYTVAINKGEVAVVLSDSCNLYYNTSSSVGSSNVKSVAGGAVVFFNGSNWYICDYDNSPNESIYASTVETVYLRVNSGKYMRKMTIKFGT